jgi:hypothetical protein
MKTTLPLAFAAAVLLAGCASQTTPSAERALPERYVLGEPVHLGSAAIVPIALARPIEPEEQGDYLTLSEAKTLGVVEIAELPQHEAVDSVQVRNLGDRPVLLIAGELLVGGNQDRVVARDTLVPAGATVNVPVFCVEQDRWDGASDRFEYAMATVPMGVRRQAVLGDQDSVWSSVAAFNSAVRAPAGGNTVHGGYQSEAVQKYLEENLHRVESGLAGHEHAVGFLFVVDGKVQAMDVFESPSLFRSARTSLLRGALAEAATCGAKVRPVPVGLCEAFVASVEDAARHVGGSHGSERTVTVQGRGGVRGVELRLSPETSFEQRLIHGTYVRK